jgi:hypothetical protein
MPVKTGIQYKQLFLLDYSHHPWRAPCVSACGCSNPLPADLSGLRRNDGYSETDTYSALPYIYQLFLGIFQVFIRKSLYLIVLYINHRE